MKLLINEKIQKTITEQVSILMVRNKLPGQVSPDYPLVFSLPILHILLNGVQSKMKQFHESWTVQTPKCLPGQS